LAFRSADAARWAERASSGRFGDLTMRMIRLWVWTGLMAPLVVAPLSPGQQVAGEGSEAKPADGVDGQAAQVKFVGDRIEQFHVSDMPLSAALRLLSVQGHRNIVASPKASGNVTANLFDVSIEGALGAMLATINCGYVVRDDVIYVYTNDELNEIEILQRPLEVRVFHLNYVRTTDAEAAITPFLSEQGSVTKSGDAGEGLVVAQSDTGGNSFAGNETLIVRDHAENLEAMADVLRQIDLRPKQVLIEATILRARLTDDNALGVDFSLVAGVDLELLGSRSVGIENVTFGELPQSRFERFNSNFTTRFVDNVPDGGLTFGILKDNVAVFVRAL